jgi:hypothetical protein
MDEEKIEYLYKYRPLYSFWKEIEDLETKQVINKIKVPEPILNKNTCNLLTTGELYFSKPRDFNDPYDCWLPIEPYKITKEMVLEKTHSRNSKTRRELISYIRQFWEGDIDKYVEHWNKDLIDDPKLFYELSRDHTDKFYVSCFSKKSNNMLMWSRYADSHKGICIGIKICYKNNLKFLKFEKVNDIKRIEAKKVIYEPHNKKIPSVDYHDLTKNMLEESLITKAKYWEYEEEYRTILSNDLVNTQIMKLEKKYISKIIFGVRTPLSIQVKTLKLIKDSKFIDISKLEVYQMEDSPINFSLSLKRLDPNWANL